MNTCMQILRGATRALERFRAELKRICTSWQTLPIKSIVYLFPEIREAEHDLQLLKRLLGSINILQLNPILSYWKDRLHINDTCIGLVKLSVKVSATCDTSFFESISSMDDETSGEQCVSTYEQYQNEVTKRYPHDAVKLISYYNSCEDLFEFLHSITAEDVYNLQEAVNDWDETLVDTKTVFDLATVKNFIDRAYRAMEVKRQELLQTPLQLEHTIICFTDVWKDNQFSDLLPCLESASLGLSSIKRIHLELTDKEQSKRRRIADILQKSCVHLLRVENDEAEFDVNVELLTQQTIGNDMKQPQGISFADLSELRDRARLLEYSSNIKKLNVSEMEIEQDKAKLCNFIRFVSIVESTLHVLKTLHTAGHPCLASYLVPQRTFSCLGEKYDDLQKNNTVLISLVAEWETNLCKMYEKYIELTYFSGDQFWQIEEYIYDRPSPSHPGYHLLKFIDIEPSSIPKPEQDHRQQREANDRLEDLGRWLSKKEAIELQEENPKNKKCLVVETTNEGILRAILSLFSATKTVPKVHRIFYCTPRTNWIQVRAFIYCSFYSQSLHQLIRPELLSQSIQDESIKLLRTLTDQSPNRTFRIGIVTTSASAEQQMINGLQAMQILKFLRDDELLNENDLRSVVRNMIRNCTLVTSKITGLGKSSIIRAAIQHSGKSYVKFPINGDFDVEKLAKRLSSTYIKLQSGTIHLDIGSIDNSQQLNEILYCLLLFGRLRFGQVAASLPEDTPVYIELDASPHSTLVEMSLFQHVKKHVRVDQLDWTTLKAETVEVQAVANYLRAIVTKSITERNINSSTFEKIELAACSQLVQQYFLLNKSADYITWTKLRVFISVFYRLFTAFSRCGYFFCEYVPRPELRMNLVQTLLESSNQFTSLSVEAVRKQQRSDATNEPATFSDAIIRWDKIHPFTVIFTDTDDPLFVYKKPTDVPQPLIDYFKAYHQATKVDRRTAESEMFPDYNQLNHVQFFIKLASLSQKYFNKAICPKCYGQYESKEAKCQRCSSKDTLLRSKSNDRDDISIFQVNIAERLQAEYVLTPDNFIKMLLIYMRIQSGVPVLIMGETGNFVVHPVPKEASKCFF